MQKNVLCPQVLRKKAQSKPEAGRQPERVKRAGPGHPWDCMDTPLGRNDKQRGKTTFREVEWSRICQIDLTEILVTRVLFLKGIHNRILNLK